MAKRTKWFSPYVRSASGAVRCTIDRSAYMRPGVYFIKEVSTGKIVYVGSASADLYKTMYRHFQTWTDKSRGRAGWDRTTYPKFGAVKCRIITCTEKQAARWERYYILKLSPRDNPIKYQALSLFDFKDVPLAVESLEALPPVLNEAPF